MRHIVAHSFGVCILQNLFSGNEFIDHMPTNFFIILALDLVKKLLVVDPSKRLTTEEALEHPWLQVGIES